MLLGVKTDNERGNVDDLLADAERWVSIVPKGEALMFKAYRM